VKVFNNIFSEHLRRDGKPAGTPGRRALPIAGDDATAKAVVTALLDEIGFDAVDAGPLAEGWRYQRDTLAYVSAADPAEMTELLGRAKRYRDMTDADRQEVEARAKVTFAS
jgi:predicted dinucleotide-binding enzyme